MKLVICSGIVGGVVGEAIGHWLHLPLFASECLDVALAICLLELGTRWNSRK